MNRHRFTKSPWTTLALVAVVALSVGFASADNPLRGTFAGDTCPHCGHAVKEANAKVIDGNELRFCNAGCADKVDAEKAVAKIIESQQDHYTLTTCPISGQELGADPIAKVYKNQLVKFCCNNCPAAFEKDVDANLAKVEKALIDSQLESYPLKTCVVSGEELGSMGDPIQAVAGSELVQFCCAGCIKQFKAEPAKFLAKIEKAKSEKTAKATSQN